MVRPVMLWLLSLQVTATIGQTVNGLQCQRIAAVECQGLGYNMTAMPNLAGHDNQLDAEQQLTKLLPLIQSGCSTPARFLLCSSLFPLCTPHVPRPISACKSLCETVHKECATHKELLSGLWPDFLRCEALPEPENHELCMQIPRESLKQQDRSAALPPAVSQSPPPSPSSRPQQPPAWLWLNWKLPPHLSKPSGTRPLVCPHNFTLDPLHADECLPQCSRDAFHTAQQKKTAENLVLALAAVCFVLTLFALVTFWTEPSRFGYPERPVLFLCLCYNLFSVCYLERIAFHSSARAHAVLAEDATDAADVMDAMDATHATDKESPPCALSPPCLASYITTSYLGLCGATWWLIFSLCFFLSSHKKWSTEALEKKSVIFHVLAWVPPLAPPIVALLLDRVRPNELTGMCSAPGFVEIPSAVLLLLGLSFTVRASHSLHALQQQMQQALGNQRFSQIRKRFLIFSLLFFLPTAASVVAAFLERYEIRAVPACVTGTGVAAGAAAGTSAGAATDHEECASPLKVTSVPTLVRVVLQLAGGTFTGLWVWSRKTCESYRARITAAPTASAASKAGSALPKKHASAANGKHAGGPLYSGINFHNIPVYSPSQSRV